MRGNFVERFMWASSVGLGTAFGNYVFLDRPPAYLFLAFGCTFFLCMLFCFIRDLWCGNARP